MVLPLPDPPELPKGMLPPSPEPHANVTAPECPAPLSLARGNYAGAILQALDLTLPFTVRVDRLQVIERSGQYPAVMLRLTVLDEKPLQDSRPAHEAPLASSGEGRPPSTFCRRVRAGWQPGGCPPGNCNRSPRKRAFLWPAH